MRLGLGGRFGVWSGVLVALVVATTAAAAAAQTPGAAPRRFLVLPHQGGSLALATSEIASVWYRPGVREAGSQLRITSAALGEAKALAGRDADALWRALREGGADSGFLFVSDGTLAIPLDQVRTAYYAEERGQATLRLQYDGDPAGKVLAGDEARRVWQALTE